MLICLWKSIFAHFTLVALYIWPHYVQMDFEKKKKNKIPLSTYTKTFAGKLTDGLRENTEVFQTPAQQH